MAKYQLYYKDGRSAEYIEIPDEVIESAFLVADWLREQEKQDCVLAGITLNNPNNTF